MNVQGEGFGAAGVGGVPEANRNPIPWDQLFGWTK